MQFQDIVQAFLTLDIDNMSASARKAHIRAVASKSGLTTNEVTNLIRGKRNDYRKVGVDLSSPDAALELAQRGIVEVALFKARRCYHSQFGR